MCPDDRRKNGEISHLWRGGQSVAIEEKEKAGEGMVGLLELELEWYKQSSGSTDK